MPIGITEEHDALAQSVRGWVERHCPPAVPRALLDADHEELPAFWVTLAEQGWLGLHVDEALGGSGYGTAEVAVVLEELGRGCVPGPFLATTTAIAVLAAAGKEVAADLVPPLAAGERVATVALDGALDGVPDGERLSVSGVLRPVLSAHLADQVVARAGDAWVVLDAGDFTASELASTDLTRRVGEVHVAGATIPPERVLRDLNAPAPREIAAVLIAAEAVGVAQWCVETAAEHAKDRRQFGRPIGQFQGVKHRCADMLARTELARAAAWDASVAVGEGEVGTYTASAAVALAADAAFDCGKDCVQVLGGIGFTWEHDAHVYLRRAIALRALAGSTATWRQQVARLALGGTRRRLSVDLPEEAEHVRAEVRAFIESVRDLAPAARNVAIADAGYVAPQWPTPWGREAEAIEQLVIEEEFRAARLERPRITIGAWALPPLMVYGTGEQQRRWIPPTLRGEIQWCQLFSEPGAGSDLAGLSTRAERVEGGWIVNGQKVWTSMAERAQWGILLARTDSDAPKHEGISFFMLDMSTPGIDVRPLRELTGAEMFNEVFFDDVFVPDDCLVGAEHDGWRATRTSLANERVFMGSGGTIGAGTKGLLALLRDRGLLDDAEALTEVGGIAAVDYALAALGFRLTMRSLTGADPAGAESSVKKLLGVEHDQRIQEVGLGLIGPDAAVQDGDGQVWVHQFLFNRSLTIAGGTSEIQRNIIGERALGLPKDP